jgi:hypothetical protein
MFVILLPEEQNSCHLKKFIEEDLTSSKTSIQVI